MNSSETSKQPPWYERAIGAFCGAICGLLVVGIVLVFTEPTILTAVIIGVVGFSSGAILGGVFPKIATCFTYLLELFS